MIETDTITHGEKQITFFLARSHQRKTACITVYPSGEVKLSVPARTSSAQARHFLEQKADWVVKKLNEFETRGCRDSSKMYVDGEVFLFLGNEYLLRITQGQGPIVTLGDKTLNVIVPDPTDAVSVRNAVFRWYRFQAEVILRGAVTTYAHMLCVPPPGYKVKNQSKRWGSCTGKNLLNFNLKIAMAPLAQIEYVAAHEVCHVRVKDHSPRYWALLRSIMPDSDDRKRALKVDGWKYEL